MAYRAVADDIDERGLAGPQCTFEGRAKLLRPLDVHNNTYSGGTTIQDGTLVVGTLIAAHQPISTALGTGNVFVDPGILRTTSASVHSVSVP